MFHEQALYVFEHRRLLQRAQHSQSQRIAELTRTRQYALIHTAREQHTGRHALACEIAKGLDPVHPWHLQVEQDERRLTRTELLAKASRTVCGDDFAADAFADLLDELEKIDFIIDR